MNKEWYLKELLNSLEYSRTNLVGFILRKDWYIDWDNDFLVVQLDNFINKIKQYENN